MVITDTVTEANFNIGDTVWIPTRWGYGGFYQKGQIVSISYTKYLKIPSYLIRCTDGMEIWEVESNMCLIHEGGNK